MTNWPHLNKSPLTEAVFDIRVQLPTTVSIESLEQAQKLIAEKYSKKKEHRSWEVQLNDANVGPLPKDLGVGGFLFLSEDEKQIVQFRLDGFTFNRLAPYTDWTTCKAEAERLWKIYSETFQPISITRTAVRYINSLIIPSINIKFSDYFSVGPSVPPVLTQPVEFFLTRYTLSYSSEIKALVTLANQPAAQPNKSTFLFDLDIFRSSSLSSNSAEIWNTFEMFRPIKNEIFFSTLTEKTVELFL